MRVALWAVALDEDLVVLRVERLMPGRIVFERRASWILELPMDREPPPLGAALARVS